MKYIINPDGTVTFTKSVEKATLPSPTLDKEMLERLSEYDDHKLFK